MRRGAAVVLGASALVLASSGVASAAPTSVTPIVVCSVAKHGSTQTFFGYSNSGPALTVGVGSSNSFSPAPGDRGQPTTFAPGTRINVFSVTTSGSVTWTLDGAQVRSPGEACQTSPAHSALASWGPAVALVAVTTILGGLLFWRTRRPRVRT